MRVPIRPLRALGRSLSCSVALAAGVAAAHVVPATARTISPTRDDETLVASEAIEGESGSVAIDRTREPGYHDPFGSEFGHGRIVTGATRHRILLFTFDDGPDHKTTPRLLNELDREGIRAIFFLTTNRFMDATPRNRRQAALAREIARRGHIVANHTVNHIQLPLLEDAKVAWEIDEAARLIELEVGDRPWLVRPPGGSRSARVDGLLAQRGYTIVLWNLGAGDFQVESADLVYTTFFRVLDRRERENGDRGGIVLLHDTYWHTVDAFPRIVAELRRRNCELLVRGEELYDFVDDLSFFYAPRGHAPPSAEAPSAEVPEAVLERRQARLRAETQRRCLEQAMIEPSVEEDLSRDAFAR